MHNLSTMLNLEKTQKGYLLLSEESKVCHMEGGEVTFVSSEPTV